MYHEPYCSGDARNRCQCDELEENNKTVDPKDWLKTKKLARMVPPFIFALTLMIIVDVWAVCGLSYWQDKYEHIKSNAVVTKTITKTIPAAYPDCDPDLVHQAKALINTLRGGGFTIEMFKSWQAQLMSIPLKERLEAHRQLGY